MNVKYFIPNKKILKVILLLFTASFLNCTPNGIKVEPATYVEGGIGTSTTRGAVLFSFNIPSRYSIGYVRIVLHDGNNSTRTSSGKGYREIRFSNIEPKDFDYTVEFWTYSNNNGASVEYTFKGGNLVNTATSYSDNYYDVLNKSVSISKTVSVKENKTVKINLDLH